MQHLLSGAATPKPLVSQTMLLREYRCAAQMAMTLGSDDVVGEYRTRADELAAAMKYHWADAFRDRDSSQGTLAIGLADGLCTDRGETEQLLVQRVEADGCRVGTGIILTRDLLKVLGEMGRVDLACRIVTSEQEPGWMWMLQTGDGTLHENLVSRWPWAAHDQAALGVVAEWMLRDLLGIRQDPKLPAFAAAEVRPLVPASLDWAEGHLDTPRGRIRVRWQRQDGQPHVEITAPPGTAEQ